VLYIWAIRHPGSGYVQVCQPQPHCSALLTPTPTRQGINDLSTPFFVVFLSTFVSDITACNLAELPPGIMQVAISTAFQRHCMDNPIIVFPTLIQR
jgi:hypothetical protein